MNSKPQSHRLDAIYEKSSPKPQQSNDCVVIYTIMILLAIRRSTNVLVYTGGTTLR